MRAIRRKDTKPERALRSALHARGHRFRVDHPVADARLARPPRPDIAFTRWRVAVFVDGCYWHGCETHSKPPRKNAGYWHAKIARNIERDREHDAALAAAGWQVVRIWEHDDPNEAVARVERALARVRSS
jgi:DNA mismatch endonuclease (patch repair protein)